MSGSGTIAVVGAGQAGAEVCTELRRQGYAGRIVLIGEESRPPYRRPPLSKAYLAGTADEQSLYLLSPAAIERHRIEWLPGTRVERIVRESRALQLSNGDTLGYDRLALTTGGRPRPLQVAGANLANVHTLRTIADTEAMRPELLPGRRMVIIGGGFIGLEVAAVAVKSGLHVAVIEAAERVLSRVTAPQVSAFFERMHREAGVELHLNAQVEALEGDGRVRAVRIRGGPVLDADIVLVGIGLTPDVRLAEDAGLAVDDGIVVDECARTSCPDIVAAGDCTSHPNAFADRRVRLESVQNAQEQARTAALSLLDKPRPYRAVPWFWSDQYDLKLQMVGLSGGYDRLILRGNPMKERSFAAFYLRAGHVIAADVIGRPQDFVVAKRVVAARAAVHPDALADETVPLKSLLEPSPA